MIVRAAAKQPPRIRPLPITWNSNKPVWVRQWSLSREKLEAAHLLVREQLEAGHIVPSTSPWNTPIFVIKKKIREIVSLARS